MSRSSAKYLFVGLSISIASAGSVQAATMTFEGAPLGAVTAPYTENGITIQGSSPAPSAGGNVAHFDVSNSILGGTVADQIALIHTGNNGEQVTVTFSGGIFNLLSVDITGWDVGATDPTGGSPATFQSNMGTIFTVAKNTTGVIDFSAMSGWTGITSFTLSMPISGGNSFVCGATNCTSVGFDDIVVGTGTAAATPLPAALPLFGTGLATWGLLGWRRKRKST